MATKTLYLLDALASSSNHLATQDGGSAPTLASFSPVTGWTVGTVAAARFAAMDSQTKRASTALTTTTAPGTAAPDNTLGDSFRAGPYTGSFAAGNWTLAGVVRGVSRGSDTQRGRLRMRVWRGTDPTGAGATQLTTADQVGTTVAAAISSAGDQTSTVTWAAPAVSLSGEYLFFKLAWETTTAGNNGSSDHTLRKGSGASVVTTDFTPPADVTPPNVQTVSATKARISSVTGADSTDLTVTSDEAFVEYQIRAVPAAGSPITAGTLVETATVTSRTSHTTTITDDELIAGGLSGTVLLKAFVRDAAGNWSA